MWHVIISVAIPMVAFVIGVFCRKLIRGHGWEWKDGYCGAELSVTAVTAAMIQMADICFPYIDARSKSTTMPSPTAQTVIDLGQTAVYALLALGLMLFIMSIHQDHESDKNGNPTPPGRKQKIMLGGLANSLGVFLLIIFLLFVKKSP